MGKGQWIIDYRSSCLSPRASCLSLEEAVSLYTKAPHFSSNCKILSDFVKPAFLWNHRKPLVFRGEKHAERFRDGSWSACRI